MPTTTEPESGSATEFDLSALSAPVDRRAARAFFDSDDPAMIQLEEQVMGRHRRYRIFAIVGVVAFLIGLALHFCLPLDDDGRLERLLIGCGLLAIVICVFQLRRTGAMRAYQIARFAEANGFRFSHLKQSAGYEGMLFTTGWDHHRWMTVNGTIRGRPVEFGNLTFTQGGARHYTRMRGYIAIRLPARLPRMLITARSNPLFTTTIPDYPHRDDLVDVGQGRAFRLYAPEGAAVIARALCTADAVALFAGLANRYTIEITGDMLFLTRFREVSVGRARQWRQQLADVQALTRMIGVSDVWQAMRAQPKRFLAQLPEMRQHFISRSPVLTALILVAGIVAIPVLIVLPLIIMEFT